MKTQWIVNDIATTIASLPHAMRRMVLEQKNNPGDYGSFEKTQPNGNGSCIPGSHVIDDPMSPGNESDVLATSSSSDVVLVPSEADPLVQEVYQSQPLLPCNGKEDWSSEPRLYSLSSSGSSSGASSPRQTVKIDIPAPNREEPRFPREKWKTFIDFGLTEEICARTYGHIAPPIIIAQHFSQISCGTPGTNQRNLMENILPITLLC